MPLLIVRAIVAAGGLKVPWTQTPMYNTLMSVAAGVGLLLVVLLGREIYSGRVIVPEGWSAAFGVLGVILTLTGLHMTLTWPLAHIAHFDNIIFGEPSLAFGTIVMAAAVLLMMRRDLFVVALAERPVIDAVRSLAGPMSLFAGGMGLAMFAIAAAGWRYTLFAAPPEEPISGAFASYPLLEATFISGLYVLVGVGLVLLPIASDGCAHGLSLSSESVGPSRGWPSPSLERSTTSLTSG